MKFDANRLFAPSAVTFTHLVLVSICVWYDSKSISVTSVFLLACAIFTLFRCSLSDPGIVHAKSGDAETPTLTLPIQSRRNLELSQIIGTSVVIQDDLPSPTSPVLRRCAICELTQPLRTKHCEEINKCVRTFDHYCPWISNCVGEYNRAWFLGYLAAETLVLAWFGAFSIANIHLNGGQPEKLGSFTLLILAIAIISMFLLMTGMLVFYHSYLAVVNMTTWEHSSWRKISYLRNFNKSKGSPFSAQSAWGNFKMYFRLKGSVDLDEDGGILWRLGEQHALLPEALQIFCDI